MSASEFAQQMHARDVRALGFVYGADVVAATSAEDIERERGSWNTAVQHCEAVNDCTREAVRAYLNLHTVRTLDAAALYLRLEGINELASDHAPVFWSISATVSGFADDFWAACLFAGVVKGPAPEFDRDDVTDAERAACAAGFAFIQTSVLGSLNTAKAAEAVTTPA